MHNHCQTLIKPNNVLIQFVLRRISLILHSIEYYCTCNKKKQLKKNLITWNLKITLKPEMVWGEYTNVCFFYTVSYLFLYIVRWLTPWGWFFPFKKKSFSCRTTKNHLVAVLITLSQIMYISSLAVISLACFLQSFDSSNKVWRDWEQTLQRTAV